MRTKSVRSTSYDSDDDSESDVEPNAARKTVAMRQIKLEKKRKMREKEKRKKKANERKKAKTSSDSSRTRSIATMSYNEMIEEALNESEDGWLTANEINDYVSDYLSEQVEGRLTWERSLNAAFTHSAHLYKKKANTRGGKSLWMYALA